jgi:hypothetical protein
MSTDDAEGDNPTTEIADMCPHSPVTTIDVEAVALSLCMTCRPGVEMACRGSPMPIGAWEACVTAFDIPRAEREGALKLMDNAMALSIDILINATQHLIGRMPTAREMWLIESTIRRIT